MTGMRRLVVGVGHGHLNHNRLREALQHARCPVAVIPEAAVHTYG